MNAMKRLRTPALLLLALSVAASCAAAHTPIAVDLRLDETNYVVGERVRGVVEVSNMLGERLDVGVAGSPDRLIVELFRASSGEQVERVNERPFVAPFILQSDKRIKLEVMLGDHYDLSYESHFFARPVLVHGGVRYVGSLRAFDTVPGVQVSSATQMFAGRPGVKRRFQLVNWARKGVMHLFLKAEDEGGGDRIWTTWDVGPTVRSTPPTISIMPSGEVVVLHRNGPDSFCRSLFWSLPDDLVLRSRTALRDPATAAQHGVHELYKKSGGVKPKENPWWKFW